MLPYFKLWFPLLCTTFQMNSIPRLHLSTTVSPSVQPSAERQTLASSYCIAPFESFDQIFLACLPCLLYFYHCTIRMWHCRDSVSRRLLSLKPSSLSHPGDLSLSCARTKLQDIFFRELRVHVCETEKGVQGYEVRGFYQPLSWKSLRASSEAQHFFHCSISISRFTPVTCKITKDLLYPLFTRIPPLFPMFQRQRGE